MQPAEWRARSSYMRSDDGDLAAPSFAIADSVTKTSSGGSRAADRAPA